MAFDRRPGTKVIDIVEHGTRVVDGVQVSICEQVWNGGGRSFSVFLADDLDVDFTEDGCFDTQPTAEQIAELPAFVNYRKATAARGVTDEEDARIIRKWNATEPDLWP
jgi:hypothetical protein